MSKFKSRERIPITVEGDPNTVWIRPELTRKMRLRIQAAGAHVRGKVGEEAGDYDFDVEAANNAVWAEWVVGWEGPDFDGVPCTVENILDIGVNDPLMAEVEKEINERSQAAEPVTSPNLHTNGHAPTTKAKGVLAGK